MIFITGGSGSGKSEYAEKRTIEAAEKRGLKPYYLATMKAYGEEEEKKIEKHRKMREGKGFITVEQAENICEAARFF